MQDQVPAQAVNPSQNAPAAMTITTGSGQPVIQQGYTPGQVTPQEQQPQAQGRQPQQPPVQEPQTPQPKAKPEDLSLGEEKPKVEPNADTTNVYEFDATGDAGLDYALNFVGNLGYGKDHPAILAAQEGNFDLIRAELAQKGVQGANEVVALAEAAYQRFAKEREQSTQELMGFAAQTAGSPENWAIVRAWASQEATPQEKEQVNAALAQGGLIAQAVIKTLVEQYSSQHTLNQSPQQVARTTASGSAAPASGPMTKEAYTKAVSELYSKKHGRIDGTPEYEALKQQRLLAMQAGY